MSLFDLDLYELGVRADKIREEKHGKFAYYVKNIQLNCTNICVYKCNFCAYRKGNINDKDAYYMTVADAAKYVETYIDEIDEIHMTGGIPADMKLSYYVELLRELKSMNSKVTIKGLTAVEIDFFSKREHLSYAEVLRELKKAGLDMLPGGGAEIFDEEIRSQICPGKLSAQKWLEIIETAHKEGITSNATMLYGHIEKTVHRERHLEMLRELQERTNGFNAFIALRFHPKNTMYEHIKQSTAVEDLKTIAVSRIILDNIPHIKGYWVMLGEKVAQASLLYGADDLDGTIVRERITHAAGATSKVGLTESDMIDLIRTAGFIPVRRDSYYNHIEEFHQSA